MVTMINDPGASEASEVNVSGVGLLGKGESSTDPSLAGEGASQEGRGRVPVSANCLDQGGPSGNGDTPSPRQNGPLPLDGEESVSAPSSLIAEPSKASEPRPRAANGWFLPSGKGAARAPAKQKRRGNASKKAPPPWSAEKRSLFLAELAATSNVTKSAMAAGMSDAQVYAERRRTPAFREAWTDALSEGYARLEFMMLERANDALAVKGKVTDEKLATNKMHEYSNKLALNLLTAHRALVRESRAGAAPSRHTPNRVAGSKARLIAKLDEMRARSSG
jgi:hypothetical protein